MPQKSWEPTDTIEGAQDVRRSPRGHGCPIGEQTVRAEKGVSLVTFFAPAKKVTRSPQASETPLFQSQTTKAKALDSGIRRNDEPRKTRYFFPTTLTGIGTLQTSTYPAGTLYHSSLRFLRDSINEANVGVSVLITSRFTRSDSGTSAAS